MKINYFSIQIYQFPIRFALEKSASDPDRTKNCLSMGHFM